MKKGYIAMVIALAMWVTFALTMRSLHDSTLTTLDAALLRFGVPAVAVTLFVRPIVRRLRKLAMLQVFAVAAGAGLPHFFFTAFGANLTSATLVAMVVPGAVPVFVVLLSFILFHRKPQVSHVLGVVTISVGCLIALIFAQDPALVQGVLWLLSASAVWSVYTVALRDAGLRGVDVVALIAWPNFVVALIVGAVGLSPSTIFVGAVDLSQAFLIAGILGGGSGIISTISYAVAVREIGGTRAAVFGTLSPVITLAIASVVRHESLEQYVIVALFLIISGVLISNTPQRLWFTSHA